MASGTISTKTGLGNNPRQLRAMLTLVRYQFDGWSPNLSLAISVQTEGRRQESKRTTAKSLDSFMGFPKCSPYGIVVEPWESNLKKASTPKGE